MDLNAIAALFCVLLDDDDDGDVCGIQSWKMPAKCRAQSNCNKNSNNKTD
jgi:uncharacterized protein YuzE